MGPASAASPPQPGAPTAWHQPSAPQATAPPPAAAPPPPPHAPRPTTVPALWAAAKAAFGGGRIPSDAELAALARALGALPPRDVGVAAEDYASPPLSGASSDTDADALGRLGLESPTRGEGGGGCGDYGAAAPRAASSLSPPPHHPHHPAITYHHIAEDAEVSLGVFVLPAGASIPLHNHPGMTVLSRVLAGRLALRSFDWAPGEAPPSTTSWRDATLVADAVLTAGAPPASLRPASGGNIHSFTAVGGPAAVLDLLAPPYRPDADGRDCTYYEEAPPAPGTRAPTRPGTRARLRAVEAPSWFTVERAPYHGVEVTLSPGRTA